VDIKTTIKLNNGVQMPLLGLGVYLAEEGEQAYTAVRCALEAGYRHIDTAKAYGNESSVGRAMRDSDLPREEVFVTTKLANQDMRTGTEEQSFYESLSRLNCEYIDLYLIHWPVRRGYNRAWRIMENLYAKGLIRAIGLSNFNPHHLETLMETATVMPSVNQIELHPLLIQKDVTTYFRDKEIQIEAWSPLGQGALLDHPTVTGIADRLGHTPAQILLRWHLQSGNIVIPKSIHRERIFENAALYDFALNEEQMTALNEMDQGHRFGADPETFSF
jgi:diketogulonate reductase-like aldo/keto reductase